MRKMKFISIFVLIIFSNFFLLYGQEIKQGSPIEPGKKIQSFKIGLLGGINTPLSPPELVNKPTTATKEVQPSLLNGLDGLGFGTTYNFGVTGKYPVSESMLLGANIEYTGWSSINSCNCQDEEFGKSENSLSLLHFGIFYHYFLYENLYAGPEFGINFFNVNVTENSSRGELDYSKSNSIIGFGLAIGYEYPLSKQFALDITAKAQFPNLLLGKENTNPSIDSESLINSQDETAEANLFLISFNIGLLFSIFY
ncbi:MAG: hypothetical protein V1779_05835 [bacterium]